MKAQLLACVAIYMISAPVTWAGDFGPAVDKGVGISSNGIVPNPGENAADYWGGSSIDAFEAAFTAIDGDGLSRAVLHNAGVTDLTPASYQFGGAISSRQTIQGITVVGYVGGTCGGLCLSGPNHAGIWEGRDNPFNPGSSTFSDLHPAGFASSIATSTDNNLNVVGVAIDNSDLRHPMVWLQGKTADELPTPKGFIEAAATSVNDAGELDHFDPYFGGYARTGGGFTHPVIWKPSAFGPQPVDVLPANASFGVIVTSDPDDAGANFAGSLVTATSNGQVHAALWPADGTVAPIDLHPKNKAYTASSVYSIRYASLLQSPTTFEVGLAVVTKGKAHLQHAMAWRGSAKTAIDLHKLLPATFVQSTATGIDDLGNVEGAAQDASGVWHEVFWPSTLPSSIK